MRRINIDRSRAKNHLTEEFKNSHIGDSGIVILNMIRNKNVGQADELVHVCRVSNEGYNYISLTDGNRWFSIRSSFEMLADELAEFMDKTSLEVEFYEFENIEEFSHFLRNYIDKRAARRI